MPLDYEPIKEYPLSELEKASTGDLLWWHPSRDDILHSIHSNRSRCIGANSVRRERGLPHSRRINIEYGNVRWRDKYLTIRGHLLDDTVANAIRYDRIADKHGGSAAILEEIRRLGEKPKWWMRLDSVRQVKPESLSTPPSTPVSPTVSLSNSGTREIEQHIKVTKNIPTPSPVAASPWPKPAEDKKPRAYKPRKKREPKDYHRYQIISKMVDE